MSDFDLFATDFRADPYPVYARFRRDDPVHYDRSPTPGSGVGWWYLFRYADVANVLKDSRFGRSIAPALDEPAPPVPPEEREPFWEMYRVWTLALEPPDHTRQRLLLSPSFTVAAVEALRPLIQAHAAALLAGLAARPSFDVVAHYAFPLTLRVITDLIGIPHDDLERIKNWSLTIAEVLDYKRTWSVMTEGNRMAVEFSAYLRDVVAERGRARRADLISRLLPIATADEQLSSEELVSLCVMLLFAGHETTVNLIASGSYLLLTNPEQRARFMADDSLTETAVDEFLRLHSPIQATSRIAYADVELRGRTIRRGDTVMLLLGSANRDEAVFADPDALDIARRPNRHLAFGRGSHFCLGAPLAMAQGGLALRMLLAQFPRLSLKHDEPRWTETFGFRGLRELPVRT